MPYPLFLRQQALQALTQPAATIQQVAEQFGLSRATLHTWVKRAREEGDRGLLERSRAPRRSPQTLPAHWAQELISLRRARPHWGAAKLLVLLRELHPRARRLPALRTLERWLQRLHLSVPPPPRSRRGPELPRPALTAGQRPNDVWTIDFKGWFRTADGARCEPLTVRDLASRFLLAVRIVPEQSDRAVRPVLQALFRTHGRPRCIRVDNGAPFAGQGALSLTTLSAWLERAGIRVEFTRPAKPQDNGAHEQMHRVLKAETLQPPAAHRRAQQRRFDRWREVYNCQRPHAALGDKRPAEQYRPSRRAWVPPPPSTYPKTWLTRRVRNRGSIKLDGRLRFIGRAFVFQTIGLRSDPAGHSLVYLDRLHLGTLHPEDPGGLRPATYARPAAPSPPPAVKHVVAAKV